MIFSTFFNTDTYIKQYGSYAVFYAKDVQLDFLILATMYKARYRAIHAIQPALLHLAGWKGAFEG